MINVIVIDDHPIVRAGMRALLEVADDIRVVAEGANGESALKLVTAYAPDVLVLDVNLPDINGLEVSRRLQAQGTAVAILVLTVHDDPQTIFGLLGNGAAGYVLKDEALETLVSAVRTAARGDTWLSPAVARHVVRRAIIPESPSATLSAHNPLHELTRREMEVLHLMAQGLDNTAIAAHLVVTKRTVQNHVSAIYSKLGVVSRAEAILIAIRSGAIDIAK